MTNPRLSPTAAQLAAAADKRLPDVLGPGLRVVFCGINPSLYSAAVGHHFARPGNRFWPALHGSGWTDRLLSPFEDRKLRDAGCGLTNLASRATAKASELGTGELVAGGRRLRAMVSRHAPHCITFLGIGAYKTAFSTKTARVGRQNDRIGDCAVWVLPNPSGLNAHYQLPDFVRLFGELRVALAAE